MGKLNLTFIEIIFYRKLISNILQKLKLYQNFHFIKKNQKNSPKNAKIKVGTEGVFFLKNIKNNESEYRSY